MKDGHNIFLGGDDWENLMFHSPDDSPYGIDVFLKIMPRIIKIQKDRSRVSIYSGIDCEAILSALGSANN